MLPQVVQVQQVQEREPLRRLLEQEVVVALLRPALPLVRLAQVLALQLKLQVVPAEVVLPLLLLFRTRCV
jgi:hypothetical protein